MNSSVRSLLRMTLNLFLQNKHLLTTRMENKMRIIDETEDFLIVEKPAGIGFHTENGEDGFFVSLEKERGEKLFPVHRLDKVTSGLIIVARSPKAARDLGELFETHQIEKYYLALSDRKPKKKQGSVVGDMSRSRRSMWKLERTKNNPARTQFFSFGSESGARLFIVRLLTGKTHQIRVALKSNGSPIIGDPLYHKPEHAIDGVDRTYLHAYSLKFELYDNEHNYLLVPSDGTHWESLDKWYNCEHLLSPSEFKWPKK